MDVEELKKKFVNKAVVDIKDVELALKGLPILVREVVRLEVELKEAESRITQLTKMMKKMPPTKTKGESREAFWEVFIDDKKNILYCTFSGKYDAKSAKMATNRVIPLFDNVRKDVDVICDITKLNSNLEKTAIFHFRKMVYTLKHIGIRRVIRVMNPKQPKVEGIFSGSSKDYDLYMAKTVAEAKEILDNLGRFLRA